MLTGLRHTAVPLLGLVLLVMVTAACSSLTPAEAAYERGFDYGEHSVP